MLRFAAAFAALTAAACVVAPLTMGGEGFPADNLVARTVLFYVITSGAYAFLPFVRRRDIAMVTMWLVLAVPHPHHHLPCRQSCPSTCCWPSWD